MMDKNLLWQVLSAVSASTIAIVSVAWLIRQLLGQWLKKEAADHVYKLKREEDLFRTTLQKEVEQFRQQLQHDKDIEIEKIRSELKIVSIEHEVRFGHLHTKQFVTIARLHRLITRTQRTMAEYFSPFVPAGAPSEEERGRVAAQAWTDLNMFFKEHEIYFDKDICQSMSKYINGLRELHIDFQAKKYEKNYALKWNEVWKKLNEDITLIKNTLADGFRKRIGVVELKP